MKFLIVFIFVLMISGSAEAECTLASGAQCNGQPCGGETRSTGYQIWNEDYQVMQACLNDGQWIALGPIRCPTGDQCLPDPCDPDENPTPGTVCHNGSIYAGLSPVGNVPMYTTPADAPRSSWNSAVDYCASLSAHGSDDWYLPARNELAVLAQNRVAIGGFETFLVTGGYWSSSRYYMTGIGWRDSAYIQEFWGRFSQSWYSFSYIFPVRCVRR